MSAFVRTLSGREMDFLYPDPGQVSFHDIAHNLNNIVRFQGGMPDAAKVTVLNHTLVVAALTERAAGSTRGAYLWALLHDAPEAYTGDIPRPLKTLIENAWPFYKMIEASLEAAIYVAGGVPLPTAEERDLVKWADLRSYEMEVADFRKLPFGTLTAYEPGFLKAFWLKELQKCGVNINANHTSDEIVGYEAVNVAA